MPRTIDDYWAWTTTQRNGKPVPVMVLKPSSQLTRAQKAGGVSVLAQTGLSFDLNIASGKLMRTIMAGLAEFERDLIRERIKSGLAAARTKGRVGGRRKGYRPSTARPARCSPCTARGSATA